MRNGLYPKLAWQNIRQNRRFYVPYLLALIGLSAAFYVMSALVFDPGVDTMRGAEYVSVMMGMGMFIAGVFSSILLLYINSFLMKQRKKELGLYNILGMGKGNIALLQCWESLYTALIGIVGGMLCGVILHALATALLTRLLRFSIPFSAGLSLPAVALTAALFGALLVLALIINLGRVRLSNPIQLLRGGQMGEKEPRTRRLTAVIGVAALGAGYAIAITTNDPTAAIALYFLAVLLVIIGTYCLFTAGSIALLKLLRRNKRFYYQTSHFIGVSGMLYRMKRNAVGLANICILSTMVMVMISGTLSLYLGTGEIIAAQYPADFQIEVRYSPGTAAANGEEPVDGQAMDELARRFMASQGIGVENSRSVTYLRVTGAVNTATRRLEIGGNGNRTTGRTIYLLTRDSYQALTGQPAPELGPGQAALCGTLPEELGQNVTFQALTVGEHGLTEAGEPLTVEITQTLEAIPFFSNTFDTYAAVALVLPDRTALDAFAQLQLATGNVGMNTYYFLDLLDLDCTQEQALALENAWYDYNMSENAYDGTGSWDYLSVSTRARMEVDGYSMSGGFLFLGILLGVIFLLATVLIIYYKQVSEGYEDQARFEIMRKVGLSEGQVRASIRSQVLTVFFLPILAAAVHILFDFNLVVQLLTLFSIRGVLTTALCTGGTLLVFCLVYGIVYLLTARTYYKIVR